MVCSSKDLIPAEKSFGVLTVMNDDLIKPRSGFGCVAVVFTVAPHSLCV